MRVRGTLTAEESKQLRGMSRYNFGLTLTNLILLILIFIPVGSTWEFVSRVIHHAPLENLHYLFETWTVCLFLLGLIIGMIIVWRRKNFRRMIAAIPETYRVDSRGITPYLGTFEGPLIPWSCMIEWWVSKSLLLITRNDTLDPIVLPLKDFPLDDIEQIRNVLQQNWKDESKA